MFNVSPHAKLELEFTPLEFETYKGQDINAQMVLIRIYSVGV